MNQSSPVFEVEIFSNNTPTKRITIDRNELISSFESMKKSSNYKLDIIVYKLDGTIHGKFIFIGYGRRTVFTFTTKIIGS